MPNISQAQLLRWLGMIKAATTLPSELDSREDIYRRHCLRIVRTQIMEVIAHEPDDDVPQVLGKKKWTYPL